MQEGRWAREVLKYVHLRCVKTKWARRTKSLAEKYVLYRFPQGDKNRARRRVWEVRTKRKNRKADDNSRLCDQLIRCSACLKIVYSGIDKKFDDVHLCSHASACICFVSNLSFTSVWQFAASQF
ncbi:hypothetical protein V5799_021198 [Amblyomma americanum]|uniref:Uncharacterized protein n=1 Tax=Amblyomma americanum TaxID=6943 RepID=A0AAQ4FPL9_AMBAM